MKKLNSILNARWLMAVIAILTIGVGNAWGTTISLSDLTFSTSNSVRIINEDFSGVSTCSKTDKVANTVSQTDFGVFNYIYNNQTYNTYAIQNAVGTTGFSSNCLSLSAGGGSPIIAFIGGTTFGNVGAWRLKTTKTSNNRFGIYGVKGNNANTHSETRASVQNDGGTISVNSSGSWISAKTVTTDIIDICVIYNKSGSSQTYGGDISISNNKLHIYINGDCVMNDGGTAPKEFTISSTALTADAVFKVLPLDADGKKSYIDDVQVWNALPTGGFRVTYDGNGKTSGTVPSDATVYTSGQSVTVKANTGDLARTGCTFAGWNTAADGSGTNYAASGSATFNISANTTLYAKWTATVTWVVNGVTAQTDNIIVPAAGKSVTPPSAPNPASNCGDKFMGWTTVNIGAEGIDKANTSAISALGLFTAAPTVTGSTTYYAVFANYAE